MKKQRKVEKDNRGVAIYARKSRITNKGDSIDVQFKQCADYAKKELGLDEECKCYYGNALKFRYQNVGI